MKRRTQYVVSGRMKVIMDDGTEMEFSPGDVGILPPGHDAWLVDDWGHMHHPTGSIIPTSG